MLTRLVRSLVVIGSLSTPGIVVAQAIPTLPSPTQAQQLLQNNPSLVARLQQMLSSSGLTPDEVRSRLKAQGYPESLLEQYLPGGTRPDSTFVPGEDIFAAVRALGLSDTLTVDSFST